MIEIVLFHEKDSKGEDNRGGYRTVLYAATPHDAWDAWFYLNRAGEFPRLFQEGRELTNMSEGYAAFTSYCRKVGGYAALV
jgi:hypothetical protein